MPTQVSRHEGCEELAGTNGDKAVDDFVSLDEDAT